MRALVILALLLSARGALAQGESAEPESREPKTEGREPKTEDRGPAPLQPRSVAIVDVRAEGLRRVDQEAALAGIKTRPGSNLDPQQITADLRAIWATGFFRDVRAEVEPVEGGAALIFVVVEKPSIREVRFVGNDDLSEDDIKAVVDVRPFTILNVDQLKRNVEKIKDLYVEKGYYLAEVNHRVEAIPETETEVDVVFDIQENAKVVVKQISFIGNKVLSDDMIKGVLQTREGNELSFLSQSGTYKREFFETDLFRIQALYYDHGFVAVKLGEPTATISPDRKFIYLSVPIEEGDQYDIGEVTFAGEVVLTDAEGKVVIDEESVRKKLSIQSGERFNRTKLFNDIQAITDVYRDQGYAYANVTPNSTMRKDSRKVDLQLEVERGDIVYFERIDIVGNTKTRDKVIRREMRVYEGERYSASGINASRARIYQLGFFETVNITTNRGSRPDTMNVTVEIKEKSTGTFQVGAGFSSVESFIATMQISQNNFLGNGHLLSLSAQLSFGDFARQLVTFQFYEPYFLDSEWSFGLNAYATQRYYRDFARNATGGSPSFGYPITPDLRVTAGYTLERVEITDVGGGGSSALALANLTTEGLNSAINGSIAYDTRDNRLFPTSGQYHVASVEWSDDLFGADQAFQFQRYQLTLRKYIPLPWQFVLKANASLGIIQSSSDEGVPISERFFPGGIYSVRGFEPRGLGPKINAVSRGNPRSPATEFTFGGNKEAVFNLEVEFPIIEAAGIKGVVFADAGNAYREEQGFFYLDTPDDLKENAYVFGSTDAIKPPLGLYYSFGFGFRWFSPIGPLRFEWGIPITKTEPTDRGLIFEFTIGNFF